MKMKKLAGVLVLLIPAFCPSIQAQDVTVRVDPGLDESFPQTYAALFMKSSSLIKTHGEAGETVAACKQVADEADRFSADSHFLTRLSAYVRYADALIQAKRPQDAIVVGDKAVAIVLLGHTDADNSSAAYSVRGQAKAFAGDLTGADQDLERAEAYRRDALDRPGLWESMKVEYSRELKGLLNFHAQLLIALGK